jgi:hypothetical protein
MTLGGEEGGAGGGAGDDRIDGMCRAMHQHLAAAEIIGERLADTLGGEAQAVDDPGDGIGRRRRRLVHGKHAILGGDDQIGESPAGIDGKSKAHMFSVLQKR